MIYFTFFLKCYLSFVLSFMSFVLPFFAVHIIVRCRLHYRFCGLCRLYYHFFAIYIFVRSHSYCHFFRLLPFVTSLFSFVAVHITVFYHFLIVCLSFFSVIIQ